MTKVLMKNTVVSNHGRLAEGNVYEVEDGLANDYIQQGLAEAVPDEAEATPTPAESNPDPMPVVALTDVQVNQERFSKGEVFLVEKVLGAALIKDKKVKKATKKQAAKATRTADGK